MGKWKNVAENVTFKLEYKHNWKKEDLSYSYELNEVFSAFSSVMQFISAGQLTGSDLLSVTENTLQHDWEQEEAE